MDTSYFYAISQVTGMKAVYGCVISDNLVGKSWVEGFHGNPQSKDILQDIVIATAASSYVDLDHR